MNFFEEVLASKFGRSYVDKLGNVKVGIAGAGGLGSNCALNLVRCGFKDIIVADLDVVEHSNLDRQFYFYAQAGMKKVEALTANLLKVNPALKIKGFNVRVDEGNVHEIFGECDIVVEAFDGAESKRMIIETFMGTGKFLVSASGICGIGDTDGIKTRKLRPELVMIGDLVSDYRRCLPVSPRVNVAAAKQADAVLEYVLGSGKGVMSRATENTGEQRQ